MRNAERTAFPVAVAFVWVIEMMQRNGRGIVRSNIRSKGSLGLEYSVAEILLPDPLWLIGKGYGDRCRSSNNRDDKDLVRSGGVEER